MRLTILAIIALTLAFFLQPMSARASDAVSETQRTNPFKMSISTGVDYSQGDYGLAQNTDIWVVPLNVRATTGDFAFTATIPYLRIDGPGGVVVGPDGQPLPGVPAVPGERSGIGDLSLGTTYTLRSASGLEVGLGGRVKFPTSASDRHLGTGKTDFTASADVSYPIGNIIPFVDVGYRVLGNPAGGRLQDGPTASVGVSAPLGKSVLIVSYDYMHASSSLTDDSHELFGGLSMPITGRVNVTGYGIAGLSKGSPDFGLGLLFTVKVF